MPLPTSPMTQFRAPWHYALLRGRQRGLGTAVLVIMVLVCGLLDLASSGFSVWTVLGVCAPWFLLFIARAPWTTSVLVAVGAMYTLSDNQFSAMVLVGWLTVAILCRRGRFPQVVMVLFLFVAGIILAWRTGENINPMLGSNIIALTVCFTISFIMRESDRRASLFLKARAEALRAQRALIARELHDTLARANTQMVLRAQQAKAQLGDPERADQVAAALDDIVAMGHQSVTDLRTMLRVLREENAVATGTAPLSADLPGALERAEHDLRAAGLRPTLACEGDASILAPFLATTMARILDEAVANMIKYAARDARCSVQLDVDDEQVGLLVINPLAGNRRATPATSSGLGLLGIRERAQAHGGGADVISDDHQWILHVAIPLNASVPSTP